MLSAVPSVLLPVLLRRLVKLCMLWATRMALTKRSLLVW
jgi:hypothetical protein